MDAFFASVEQRDNPQLQGKPVAVGGDRSRGVIAAASYEARKFGVRSAMPTSKALALCPSLVLVKSNRETYVETSRIIRNIFHDYTDYVEPLSLDEAFLDVTFHKRGENSATLIAQEIRQRIFEETNLTASAGVSYNKFLAKVASDINKPNGIFVIPPEEALSFLETLKIEKFFGIGKVTVEKFHKMGIFTGKDLKRMSKNSLMQYFGKVGDYYFNIVRGVDNREVQPFSEQKSIGAEHTFENDIVNTFDLRDRLLRVIDRAWKSIEKKKIEGKTVTLKMKYSDFSVITRSRTVDYFIDSKSQLISEALIIFKAELPFEKPIRLLGVTLSNFKKEDNLPEQMLLNI